MRKEQLLGVKPNRSYESSLRVFEGPQEKPHGDLVADRYAYSSRLGFIVTDTCNIRCRHCIPESDHTKKAQIDWEAVEATIRSVAANTPVDIICFTGGEPMLHVKRLRHLTSLCKELGLEATVMTNGYWATSREKARKVLESLCLTGIGLSTDSFHQEFLPIERIRFAIEAAWDLDLHCAVRVCHLEDPGTEVEAIRRQLAVVSGKYHLEHQPVQPYGRARHEVEDETIFRYDTTRAICRSADSPAVNVRGEVTACCGATSYWQGDHLLKFGNIRKDSIEEVMARADRSVALHVLRLWGPGALLELVRQQAELEGVTLSGANPKDNDICSLCGWLICDPVRSRLLETAAADPAVIRRIAFDRMEQLGETSMMLQLDEQ